MGSFLFYFLAGYYKSNKKKIEEKRNANLFVTHAGKVNRKLSNISYCYFVIVYTHLLKTLQNGVICWNLT